MSEISRPVKAVRTDGSSGDARKERWREHRKQRRAELVQAAVRAIQDHGAEVGMDDIAAEAGVSKPVLYRHFSDKSDLYQAVGEWGTALLMERLEPQLQLNNASPNDLIHRLLDSYLGLIEEYPDLYRFVVQRTFADRPVDADPVHAEKTLIANSLARLLGRYLRVLGLDSGGVEVWSYGLVGLVQSAGDWWLDRQTMSRADLTGYLAQVIWSAIDGILRAGGMTLDPDEPLDILSEVLDDSTEEDDQDV